ncbi:MAG: S8 family serine peptidase [Phycisphaeraceae bacterium]|nr:MAG: S8 family serine peptidase [Phycisphaeraceae bacterium]
MAQHRPTPQPHASRRRLVVRVGIGAAALLLATAGATDYEPPAGGDPRFDEGVLELLPGVDIQTILNRYGFTLRDSIESRNIHLVSFQPAMTNEQFELLFVADPDVDHSELNYDTGDAGPSTRSLFFGVAPAQFGAQPVWDTIGLSTAHDTATGAGTTIAIIDTGLDTTNPMFLGLIDPAAASFVGAPGDIQDVGNGINDDGDGMVDEMVGHGTWVTGIAHMVAPDAMLMPIRALDDEGFSNAFTLAKAVYYAVDHGADVVNLSLGSIAQVRIVERAVDDASARGVIVVAAAGNQNAATPEFPAGNNKCAGIAAVDLGGVKADFSNYSDGSGGNDLLLAAPGIDITGPVPGGFGEASGTSAAVPLVAGTAALLIEKGTIRRWTDFRQMANHAAIDIRDQNPGLPDNALGKGMLDVAAATAWPGPCFADLTDDGVTDLADIEAFITLFVAHDEGVDYVAPRGVWDLGDLLFFVQSFIAGCP